MRELCKERKDYSSLAIAMESDSVYAHGMSKRKGFGMIKQILVLVVLVMLVLVGGITYLAWQKADMSGISGREGLIKGQEAIGYVDIKKKIENALNSKSEVVISEAEINQYIAKNLKMNQGGLFKGFASVQGVYVDLTDDHMEIFIEREIAQYGDEGAVKEDIFPPFNQTVSMKLKVYNGLNDEGKPAILIEFPGATIGKVPAPGMLVKIVLSSFLQIRDHFETEIGFYEKMNKIAITDGVITLDPNPVAN